MVVSWLLASRVCLLDNVADQRLSPALDFVVLGNLEGIGLRWDVDTRSQWCQQLIPSR